MRIIVEQCEEGGYSAWVKEMPGAISQGESIKEAAENVLDALKELLAAQVVVGRSNKATTQASLK